MEPGDIVTAIIYFVTVLVFILINVLILVWLERRVAGFFQERLGPNRVGPFGLLQTVNDTVKLLGKESIIPKAADRMLFKIAPVAIFTTAVALYTVIPFGKDLSVTNTGLGLFFFISFSSTTTIAILMAGWGSNNKYSLLGGMRTVAQIISYEIPLVLSMLGVVMLVGSLNLSDIVNAQKSMWYVVLQPVAFIIFLIAGTAELNRAPFDMPEAEQELVGGYHTEYTGMRFALFFLSEYANLFSISAIAATLFLGGWQGPLLPSFVWFMIKVYAMIFVFMWFRWTFPRFRMDHMMKLNWKLLIPLALANILLTGAGIKLFQYYKMIGRI
jgi:NADH-quinone oxidoreductase subunit H